MFKKLQFELKFHFLFFVIALIVIFIGAIIWDLHVAPCTAVMLILIGIVVGITCGVFICYYIYETDWRYQFDD